jgi:hypothetical protein
MFAAMIRRISLFILLLTVTAALAQPRAEKIGAFSDEASEKLKAAISADGYRVYLPNTLVGCEVWLAQKVEATKNAVQGTSYPELGESQFLGVIVFPKGGGADFRGQSVRPGSYTMRYIALRNDGNHLGVAPYPDFVALIPIADDPDPSAKFDTAKLIEMSRGASRTTHPATFEMMPPESGEPNVTQTDDGWVVFHGSVVSKDKKMPVAVVVKGSAAQ